MILKDAEILAKQLMQQHGLTEIGWRFEFDNAKRRFGVCNYTAKIIGLSRSLVELNDEARVRNTILHEIAHALTPGHGHDRVWSRKAREIGSDGERCYKSQLVETPSAKYQAVCNTCGHTHKRHKTTNRSRILACGFCYKKGITNILVYQKMY